MTIRELFGWGTKKLAAPFLSFIGQSYGTGWLGQGGNSKKYLTEYRNWVFACVQARAEAVGAIELKLYKGDSELEKNDILNLLYKVNPTMTKEDLFMGTQAYLDLDGNAYWFLARENDGKGAVKELWLLRPDRMEIVCDKDNPLIVQGYVYTQPDGKRIPFATNEILHFKNFNPIANLPFPHKGMGVVEAAQWAIETDNEARQWNYAFFKNSAKPDGFLVKEGTGTIAAEEYKRIKEMWEQEHQGSRNAHKPAILAGGLKWQDLTRSQKDMDFIEQRRFSRDEILALFRTPKTVIGITEDVNRANAEASEYVFALRTVDPLMAKIVSTLNEFLLPEFGDDLYLDYVSPVPADRVATVNGYALGLDKWLTRNEIRALEGLPASTNGNEIFGTLANVPIDTVPPQPAKAAKPTHKRHHTRKSTAAEEAVADFISKLPTETETPPVQQLSKLAIDNHIELWKKQIEVDTERLTKELNAFLAKQEAEVIKNIIEETKGLEVKEYKFKALADLMYDEEGAIKAGISIITPNIKRYIKQAGEQAMLLVGSDAPFDETNPATAAFTKKRAAFFSKTFNDTTTEKLQAELKVGLEANETTAQLSERVAQFYKGERDYRSERAARTEASAAGNFGSVEAYKQVGIEKKEWFVVAPEDDECVSLTGQVVDINENFVSDSGEEYSEPPAHPNCVCKALPVRT